MNTLYKNSIFDTFVIPSNNTSSMKLILFFCLFVPSYLFAQKGVEFSANINPCFSFIINQNDMDNTEYDQARVSIGMHTTLTAGYNFNKYMGIGSGIGYVQLVQNYIKPATINAIEKLQHTSSRSLSYVRLPLFLRISSNPQARFSIYARLGMQGDILLSAVGKESFPITANKPDEILNYTTQVTADNRPYNIYKTFVFGLHASIGTKLRFNDQFALLFLWHVESSISNPENDDAPLFFTSESFEVVDDYGRTKFRKRQHSWNFMTGLSIGLVYTPFANQTSLSNNKRKYRPALWR